MSRITPLTGTDEARLIIAAANLLRAAEIHSTNNHWRLFLQNRHIGGPVWHGNVANQAAMLLLSSNSPNTSDTDCPNGRSVFPMDECYREDTGSVWKCIANRGLSIDDWLDMGGAGTGTSTSDILDGGVFGSSIPDDVDGGTFGDALTDEIDGNDEL